MKICVLCRSIFLNDTNECISRAYNGLTSLDDITHQALDTDDVSVFLKLYILLYTDDTINLTEGGNEPPVVMSALRHCRVK